MDDKEKSIRKWLITVIIVLSIMMVAVSGGIIYYMYNNGSDYAESNSDIAEGEGSGYNAEDAFDIVQIDGSPNSHVVGLRRNGTVVATGDNRYGQCNVKEWKDIAKIYVGNNFTVGLKNDGTLVATGYNDGGKCNVSDAKDIVEVYPKSGCVLALNKNAELITVIDNITTVYETGVEKVSASDEFVVGIKKDGRAFVHIISWRDYENERTFKEAVENWEDVVEVLAGNRYVAGLKSDGTVIVEEIKGEMPNVDMLTNIKSIYDQKSVVGVTNDGKVIVINASEEIENELGSWENIEKLVFGIPHPIVGLKSDGTVVAKCKNSEKFDVESWTDIVDVVSNEVCIVGLKKDGTVVYDAYEDRFNFDDWNK